MKVPAVIVGVVVGNVVLLLVGFIAGAIDPPPPELVDPQTPEATAQRVDSADVEGLLVVLFGAALGGLLGGAAAVRVARDDALFAALGTAGLLSVWGFYSFYVFYPARLWFPIGMFACFVLCTLLGAYAARRVP